MKKFIFTFVLVLATLSASAQYRVDRLVTAGRSALFYEDFVTDIWNVEDCTTKIV